MTSHQNIIMFIQNQSCVHFWCSVTLQWGLLRVEADVVKFPLLSLLGREENREGDTCNFNTLHNY